MKIPFAKEVPSLKLSPVQVAERCRTLPGLVFFDTALVNENSTGAISLIAADPEFFMMGKTDADWTALRKAVADRQVSKTISGKIPLGFAAGWVDYNGSFCFGFYDSLLAYRHSDALWISVNRAHEKWAGMLASESPMKRTAPICFTPGMQRADFVAMVERAQEYISAGDIYQVNLSHRFTAPWQGADPFLFYQSLRRRSPAPHAAFLSLEGRTILSSSPELFLEMSGRHIRTRPIKGTRPRHKNPATDAKNANDLRFSPKENAELIMITDLERNDLGQVCDFGSVKATEMLKLERYEQVFHLVSTVEGILRREVDHITALRACFPGGSITGAPKKRAMEIIAELEPQPRGLYTGAIGYFGFNGESQFNIAIRTVIIEEKMVHFHVGAGIVADSRPEMEWQETLDKAAGILLAANHVISE